jgi:hypothetical protein
VSLLFPEIKSPSEFFFLSSLGLRLPSFPLAQPPPASLIHFTEMVDTATGISNGVATGAISAADESSIRLSTRWKIIIKDCAITNARRCRRAPRLLAQSISGMLQDTIQNDRVSNDKDLSAYKISL